MFPSRAAQMVSLALEKKNKSFGTYKQEEYVTSPRSSSSEDENDLYQVYKGDSDNDIETTASVNTYSNANDEEIADTSSLDVSTLDANGSKSIDMCAVNTNDNVLQDVNNDENDIDIVVESVASEFDSGTSKQAKTPKNTKKRKNISETHPLLAPCNCKKKCVDRVIETRRKEIHEAFWKMKTRDESCVDSR